MRNVMKKAWKIAREGQRKFGGKVKEYFAEALRMAWAVVKKEMDKIKFQIVPSRNGHLFAVLDSENIKVTHHKLFESLTSRFTVKEEVEPVHIARNKNTNEVYRLYQYIPGNGKYVIEVDGQTHEFKNERNDQ